MVYDKASAMNEIAVLLAEAKAKCQEAARLSREFNAPLLVDTSKWFTDPKHIQDWDNSSCTIEDDNWNSSSC